MCKTNNIEEKTLHLFTQHTPSLLCRISYGLKKTIFTVDNKNVVLMKYSFKIIFRTLPFPTPASHG